MNSAVDHNKLKIKPAHRLRTFSLWGLVLAALLLAGLACGKFYWHERAWFYLTSHLNADAWAGRSVWLPDYQVEIEARPVAGIDDDLSAIDFAPDRKRLLAVTNAVPIKLVEMDRDGRITAQYPLVGFEDVEGLAYMGDGLVAVADEVQQQLVFFRLPERPGQAIDKHDAQTVALALTSSAHNKGFEGVAYDAAHDRLFVAKERNPRQLFAITGIKASLAGKLQIKVQDLSDWIERSVFAKDISDLHYDARTGHLLVLSHESKLVIELGENGEMVSFRTLLGHLGDLKESAGQAEGLTLDDQGTLYVVSEPNLFYRFRKN
ncbi:SdiA-regulated domain-containing protein [Pseudomonas sp. TCU-HL1]|uniref:SdiA-regulated domain-containing protein n=1 Tax=Pseudomonas sp. TCU-HL1 TaxID=1856685 RepID=UPI00085557B4|nr:SdiA-regulated domain-containing protein [Pseudomonas sp. TCU-HL1]AOE84936.1 membrane protein [Pseudomonas sp. TCU-HL1]